MIVINDDKSLCMLLKKPRSKWYTLCCIGRNGHYRKDATLLKGIEWTLKN